MLHTVKEGFGGDEPQVGVSQLVTAYEVAGNRDESAPPELYQYAGTGLVDALLAVAVEEPCKAPDGGQQYDEPPVGQEDADILSEIDGFVFYCEDPLRLIWDVERSTMIFNHTRDRCDQRIAEQDLSERSARISTPP